MLPKILETIREYNLIQAGDKVLVAVSGGADSTALIYLLYQLKDELQIKLHIAHLNHLIRRGDAELDARYVRDLAVKLDLPFIIEEQDVPAFAKENKLSLETAARAVRYAFLEKAAQDIQADKIAVAHNADDNVETFLMRLLRGSGLKGLCGIPVQRGKIIRPLIKTWRREIEDYVGSLKLVPRRDYTNYESLYLRNRVRLKLIPQLKMYNLNIKQVVLQTVLLLNEDWQCLEKQAAQALVNIIAMQKADEISLNIPGLRMLDVALQGHLLRLAIEKIKGDMTQLSYTHINDIFRQLLSDKSWELHLPDGIFVRQKGTEIIFSRHAEKKMVQIDFLYPLAVPGEVRIHEIGKTLRASLLTDFSLDAIIREENKQVAFVDYAVLTKQLVVRSRREGDRLIPLGMKGSKKLQDLFIDEKILQSDRENFPVVESHGQVVWVAGMRLDERCKVTPATKTVVKLEIL